MANGIKFSKTLHTDAFGNDKITYDVSELHGVFTFDIPDATFNVATKLGATITLYEKNSLATGYADSVNGEGLFKAGPTNGDVTILYSKRHPRFHPNRGKLISGSAFFDTHAMSGSALAVGFFNFNEVDMSIKDALFIYVENSTYYLQIYSLGVLKYNQPFNTEQMAKLGIDPTKGHLFDIEAQLRNVGNIFGFLSDPDERGPVVCHEYRGLNKMSDITISTPALHAGCILWNKGTTGGQQPSMRIGCFDVSTESPDSLKQEPQEFSNAADVTAVPSTGVVLLVVYQPYTYKGSLNTRDSQYYGIEIESDKKGDVEIYKIEDIGRLKKTGPAPIVDGDFTFDDIGTSLKYIDNSSGLIVPYDPGTGIIPFDNIGLVPFIKAGLTAGIPKPLLEIEPKDRPRYLTHGEAYVVVGYGNVATMRVNYLSMGDEI